MNKITYEEPPGTTFGDLVKGDMFSHASVEYMKVKTNSYPIKLNSINLADGTSSFFLDQVPTKRINRLTIEKIS